ncbi:MAG: hypothetical protein WC285_02695 [Candidatus Gracilibacteria bacterium]|jgi:hypothetical protein
MSSENLKSRGVPNIGKKALHALALTGLFSVVDPAILDPSVKTHDLVREALADKAGNPSAEQLADRKTPVQINFDVPFASEQHVRNGKYSLRACSPAALWMLIEWARQTNPNITNFRDIDSLIERLLRINGIREGNFGWNHSALADAANSFGAKTEAVGMNKEPPDAALGHLLKDLANGPVMAFMHQRPVSPNGHTLVIRGFRRDDRGNEWFDINDPITANPDQVGHDPVSGRDQARFRVKGHREISLREFLEKWTRRWIVVRP